MKICVVIPVYNESQRIGKVLKELEKYNLPIVVVDDGSKDDTFVKVRKFKVLALRHRVNLGKGAALKTGCEAAFLQGAEAVIIMDGDGQHDPEDLPHFIENLKSRKCDLIFGVRTLNHNMPLIRVFGNRLASGLIKLLFGIYVSDLICGYRAFTKRAFKKIKWESLGYGVETEIVIKAGMADLNYCEVPVQTIYYDKFKGVTVLDALNIFFSVLKWRLFR